MIAGIDGGLDGGIVVLDDEGSVLWKYVAPVIGQKGKGKRQYNVPEMARMIREIRERGESLVFLERAQAMPGQGVSSMFSIGYGYGIWQGILTAVGVPFEIASPRMWQGVMFSGVSAADTKKASALVAGRLKPHEDWRATERSRISHSGLTDAFCIAEWGRRKSLL